MEDPSTMICVECDNDDEMVKALSSPLIGIFNIVYSFQLNATAHE